MLLFALLFAGASTEMLAQSPRKKKSRKPKSTPCAAGCKANLAPPEITGGTPEEEARQKELSDLARGLRTAVPHAYDQLAAFAGKNASNVWGARAALALGYEDYSKNRAQPAVVWLKKAEGDTTLREYTLYWSAQAKRALKRSADAYIDMKSTIIRTMR